MSDPTLVVVRRLPNGLFEESELVRAARAAYDAGRAQAALDVFDEDVCLEATRQALLSVVGERLRQSEMWGVQKHPDGTGSPAVARMAMQLQIACDAGLHADPPTVTWADILLEEVAEALAEREPSKLRAELVQVAAVVVQWIEGLDAREEV